METTMTFAHLPYSGIFKHAGENKNDVFEEDILWKNNEKTWQMFLSAHPQFNFLYIPTLNGGGKITHIFAIPYSMAQV